MLSIGRESDNDLVLDNIRVSRHHARIVVRDTGMIVHDLSSTNGVYVNGTQILCGTALSDGAVLNIGGIALHLEVLRG